jgi:Fe-S-cluster-containing hydrogenase component 2
MKELINTFEIIQLMDRTMTDEVKNENEVVAETEQKQPSYIELIAAKMSRESQYNNFYKKDDIKEDAMPALPADTDNAATQNAHKKNAPGEKAVPKGPGEEKGGAGSSTARKADKSNGNTSAKAAIQQDPDNKKNYDAMGVKLGEEADLTEKLAPIGKVGGSDIHYKNQDREQHHFQHGKSKTISVNDEGSHDHVMSKVKAAGVHPSHQAGVAKAIHKAVSLPEARDLDADSSEKALKHDCATHVVHEEHGEGKCIPGMHTLEENEDGTGFVTHYDVMFDSEDGPYIVEDCPVEDLEVIKEKHHGHMKKKSKVSEALAPGHAHHDDKTYATDDEADDDHQLSYANHQAKVISHSKKQGYKVNHDDNNHKHKRPDITMHTAMGDHDPHGYTVHKNGNAHKDKVVHAPEHIV